MGSLDRTYSDALSCLNSLDSNAAFLKTVKDGLTDLNLDKLPTDHEHTLPQEIDWEQRAGYKAEDLKSLSVIHVAGTKGKGSLCTFIASILKEYGVEGIGDVGLYTSPHLVTVRERIRINNSPISEELFAKYFFEIWDRFSASGADAGHPDPTGPGTKPFFFRFMTIMALHVFLREGVRTAVMECGIGGEYDSTNIFPQEAVSVTAITKLGIDHVGLLGKTIDSIAWHKAGIMKRDRTCFTIPQVNKAMTTLEHRAKEIGAILEVVDRRADIEQGIVRLGLDGDFQKDNASLAVATAMHHLKRLGVPDLTKGTQLPAHFIAGLWNATWPGRCDVRIQGNIEWCLDGAHTTDSIESVATWFAKKPSLASLVRSPVMLIFNQQTEERNARALVRTLYISLANTSGRKQLFDYAVFSGNAFHKKTGNDLTVQKEVAAEWSALEPGSEVLVCSSVEEAVAFAKSVSKQRGSLKVLVTGSLYLVGGIARLLEGVDELL